MRPNARKATVAAATLLIAGSTGAATATALSGSSDADRVVATAPLSAPAAPVFVDAPVRPAPTYSAAERSTQKPTARVAEMHKLLAARFPDVAGRPVRGIKAADGTQAWVVSGTKHTCLGADNSDGTGYSCSPNDDAQRGISVAERRDDGTQRTVALVPDEVASANANGRRIEAKNNLVVAEHQVGSAVQANPNDGRAPFRVGTD